LRCRGDPPGRPYVSRVTLAAGVRHPAGSRGHPPGAAGRADPGPVRHAVDHAGGLPGTEPEGHRGPAFPPEGVEGPLLEQSRNPLPGDGP
jgi:hypothetical protein